jgi:hypothetical protein
LPSRVFDPVRRKSVLAQPEEKVRQSLVRWLIETVKVPARLIAVEYSLSALDKGCRKRADVVAWRPGGVQGKGGLVPWLLAECKAPGIPLGDSVADQVRGYAEKIRARYVLITNGTRTRYFQTGEGRYDEIAKLPEFPIPG